ncbi:MAG: hypothetical protein P1P77_08535 [Spirochaetaceae bacterium]|nr:hypothetical protein [Spirochaetaceae bacterium]
MNLKSHNFHVIVLVALTIAVLAGCSTAGPQPRTYETIELDAADLHIELTYVDDETIEYRHGRNDSRRNVNPYYKFPAVITKKNFYVFEFSAATAESTVNFRLEDIDFRKGLVNGSAKSIKYLLRIWSHYNQGQSQMMTNTLEDTLLPPEFSVSPGNPVSGYLAFAENYPSDGKEAEISFYLTTPNGESGRLAVPIYFYEDRVSDELPVNTGIFSE